MGRWLIHQRIGQLSVDGAAGQRRGHYDSTAWIGHLLGKSSLCVACRAALKSAGVLGGEERRALTFWTQAAGDGGGAGSSISPSGASICSGDPTRRGHGGARPRFSWEAAASFLADDVDSGARLATRGRRQSSVGHDRA